jgi:hypothetical protein
MRPPDKAFSPPPYADEPPPALREAVTALVRAKARVDRLARGGPDDRALAARCGLPAGEDGTSLFAEVFPFHGHWNPLGPSDLRNVPLDLTMGNSWRWHPENIAQGKRATLKEELLSCAHGSNLAVVCWIVPLGLFLAHEGKNRIEFLRSEGATHYPALTTPYDYPAPDRLALVQVSGPNGDEWWAVLDQDSIEPLRCPEWSREILTAYGVSTIQGWPEDYPPYAAVRQAFDERSRRNFRPLKEAQVSLKALQAKEVKASEEVSVSLIDLPGVQLRRGWIRAMTILVATVMLASLWFRPQIRELSPVSAGLGAVLMLAVCVFCEILIVPRRQFDLSTAKSARVASGVHASTKVRAVFALLSRLFS